MNIRNAVSADLPRIMELYKTARIFMSKNGNPNQWGNTYPPKELIEHDIKQKHCFVCESEKNIIAVFYYSTALDPTYQIITDGKWLNNESYGVVHRITSDGTVKGAASFCLSWAFSQCKNLKIDTHKDNHIMQRLLCKNGFTYCGIIYTDDGFERLAYQKSLI